MACPLLLVRSRCRDSRRTEALVLRSFCRAAQHFDRQRGQNRSRMRRGGPGGRTRLRGWSSQAGLPSGSSGWSSGFSRLRGWSSQAGLFTPSRLVFGGWSAGWAFHAFEAGLRPRLVPRLVFARGPPSRLVFARAFHAFEAGLPGWSSDGSSAVTRVLSRHRRGDSRWRL